MNCKEIRKLAREDLKGNWTTSVLVLFIYSLFMGLLSFCVYFYIGIVASILLCGALELGVTIYFFNLRRKPEFAEINNVFEGFKYFTSSLCIYIIRNIFVFLWSLLLIVPGIIKSISYTMSYFVFLDNKKLSANDCIKKSKELMKGHKWEYFVLYLSFIGWFLLGLLTFGIGLFWVDAYFYTAKMNFYEKILNEYNEKNSAHEEKSLDIEKQEEKQEEKNTNNLEEQKETKTNELEEQSDKNISEDDNTSVEVLDPEIRIE